MPDLAAGLNRPHLLNSEEFGASVWVIAFRPAARIRPDNVGSSTARAIANAPMIVAAAASAAFS
jgi:hypothetical protein